VTVEKETGKCRMKVRTNAREAKFKKEEQSMNDQDDVNKGDEQINAEKPDDKNEGGLKIKTNVKAGADDPPVVVGGGN
jgi:hypothetical protein